MKFENFHLHVGYYKNNNDLEGIFFKETDKPTWYLYFHANSYNIQLKKGYKKEVPFGYLVRTYDKADIDEQEGNKLFENFLFEESIIK